MSSYNCMSSVSFGILHTKRDGSKLEDSYLGNMEGMKERVDRDPIVVDTLVGRICCVLYGILH